MGYLRPHQVEEIENEKRVIEHTLTNQRDIQDRGNLQAHSRRIDKQLEKDAPPDLTGEDRDRMTRECGEIEGRLVPLMPSDEQMRRNSVGAVGQHNRFDKAAKEKTKQFPEGYLARWKDNQLALNKGLDDPDIANFERMRPLHNQASMLGAQIPGTQYHGTNPSEAFKTGHDRTFGNEPDEPQFCPDSDGEPNKVEDPESEERNRRVRKPAKPPTHKKATRKKKAGSKRAVKMTILACGREMGPQGQHSHIAHCETCQEAAKE